MSSVYALVISITFSPGIPATWAPEQGVYKSSRDCMQEARRITRESNGNVTAKCEQRLVREKTATGHGRFIIPDDVDDHEYDELDRGRF